MSTPLSELLSLVAEHGKSQASAFLQGEAVIAGSPDQEIWEHLARHDILWDGLTIAEQDRLRDVYLEAFKQECARRSREVPEAKFSYPPVIHPSGGKWKPVACPMDGSFMTFIKHWKHSLESSIEGLLPESPDVRGTSPKIIALDMMIEHMEACESENEELGRILKEYGANDGEFLTAFLARKFALPSAHSGIHPVGMESKAESSQKTTQEGSVCEVEMLGEVTFEVISGVEGHCLSVNDRRVAGPKPWGGGRVLKTWKVPVKHLLDAVGLPSSPPSSEDKEPGISIGYLEPVQYEIIKELCRSFHILGAPIGMQAALGSWGDTLTDEEVLELLQAENAQASTTPQKGGQRV